MIGCAYLPENFLAYELTCGCEHRGSGLPVCPNRGLRSTAEILEFSLPTVPVRHLCNTFSLVHESLGTRGGPKTRCHGVGT